MYDNTTPVSQEYQWLESVSSNLNEDNARNVSWSAYHANQCRSSLKKRCVIGLLPLLDMNTKSVSTIKHGIDIVKKTSSVLNPNQTPVVELDEPLYEIYAKSCSGIILLNMMRANLWPC